MAQNPPARKAAPKRGAAARREKKPEPKTVEWNGIELRLPAKLPAMGVTASFRRLQRAASNEDPQSVMGYLVDMVDTLLSGDEPQCDQVWAHIDSTGADAFKSVFDLLDAVTAAYGTTPGESTASR